MSVTSYIFFFFFLIFCSLLVRRPGCSAHPQSAGNKIFVLFVLNPQPNIFFAVWYSCVNRFIALL